MENLELLARLNRCVTMMMPEDITLTLHSIEYVNAGFNFFGDREILFDYAKPF